MLTNFKRKVLKQLYVAEDRWGSGVIRMSKDYLKCAGCNETIEEDIILYKVVDSKIYFSHDNMIPEVKGSCPDKSKIDGWNVIGVNDLKTLLEKAKKFTKGTPMDELVPYDKNESVPGIIRESKDEIEQIEELAMALD